MRTVSSLVGTVIFCLFLVSAALSQDKPDISKPSQTGTGATQTQKVMGITLSLKACTVSEAVSAIGDKYKINIVADVYVAEALVPNLIMEDVPRDQALVTIGNAFGRKTYFVNGIVVWRHARLAQKVEEAIAARTNPNWRWKTKGKVTIQRHDSASATSDVTRTQAQNSLPADLVSLQAVRAPMLMLAKDFTGIVGWRFNIDGDLQDRRVSASLQMVTPSAVLGALTFLLNSAQSLTIRQTEAQKKEEEKFVEANPAFRVRHELAQVLLLTLNEQQQVELAEKGTLEFPVGDLSPALQKLAAASVDAWKEYMSKENPSQISNFTLDPNNYKKFKLVLRSDLQVEIHGRMSNTQAPYKEGMAVVF